MKIYYVEMSYSGCRTVTVEARSEEQARERAIAGEWIDVQEDDGGSSDDNDIISVSVDEE